jgi:hypothetical protein
MFGRLQCEGFEDEEAAAYALGIGPMQADGAPPADYVNWDGERQLDLELDNDILDTAYDQPELDDLETLLRNARTLVVAIRRSGKRRRRLEAYFAPFPRLRPCDPILDIHGRWNTIHAMFERLDYIKQPLEHLCSEDHKLLPFWPTPTEWSLISKFTKILEAYKEATDILSSDTRVTVQWVIPLVDELMRSVEDFEKHSWGDAALKQALHLGWEALQHFYQDLKKDAYYVGLFLNPRVKGQYIHQHWPEEESEVTTLINRIWERDYRNRGPGFHEQSTTSDSQASLSTAAHHHTFGRLLGEDLGDDPNDFPLQDDLCRYRQDPRVSNHEWENKWHTDPLLWWREKGQLEYPRLAAMMRDYAAIQGTLAGLSP